MRTRRIILLALAMAVFTGSFCVTTGKAETAQTTQTAPEKKEKKQKVIVIDAGHQTREIGRASCRERVSASV